MPAHSTDRSREISIRTTNSDEPASTAGASFGAPRSGGDRTGSLLHTDLGTAHRPILVDGSWRGLHGISRFATEVLDRIVEPHRVVAAPGSPTSPKDVLAPWRLRLSSRDLVYTPGFNAGATRARQLVTLHDLIHLQDGDESSRAKRAYYDHVVRPVIRRTGSVVTVSVTSRRAIREWLHDDRVEVVDVGNGCSDLFFAPVAVERSRNELLYVGNLKPHKNPAPVFAALARVPTARLTVVTGDVDGVRSMARIHGVEDRVHAAGSLSDGDLRDLYAASTAVVLPSLREGFGLPAVEALAAGTPVIHWSGCSSVTEIVGKHGIAVDRADDARAWADAIEAAMRGHIWEGRPDGWAERWSFDAVARRLDETLHRVALQNS